ncbi:ATP-binding cassette domain-containing protein [Reinekea thalattae]|uniref:ATP-binding cassette domain-containing protein n=1 Tax=Reinekea thalattae TaxID=2593301 RepID=A0A5C8Z2S2_9GAMM|nr:ATP-binding cassette domain-containing protein [Reinekea thalattae]TXR51847.1 ATP-binding cassette domain-containing protein [Reinekea thalattae]
MFKLDKLQIFKADQALFQPVSLMIEAGQIATIKGPSGIGKSTILSDILGTLEPGFKRSGHIYLNGSEISDVAVEQRHIGILFQEDLLFPHLNVYQNLVFGVPSHWTKKEKQQRIKEALAEAGLAGFESRDIATLSGGQRSRVSLLRTLLSEPRLMLLDEPFSKLDDSLREQFRGWVFSQLKQQNIAAVLVTHDQQDIPDGAVCIELEASHA